MKNKAFSLIEINIAILIMIILSSVVYKSYYTYFLKIKVNNTKSNIVNIIDLYRKKAIYEKTDIVIYFDFEKKYIVTNSEYFLLDNSFKYVTKNKENLNFSRKILKSGNFDKGFTILILDNKNYELGRISYNTTNNFNMPIKNY